MLARDRQFPLSGGPLPAGGGVDIRRPRKFAPRQADLSARDHVDLILSPTATIRPNYRLSIDGPRLGQARLSAWQPTWLRSGRHARRRLEHRSGDSVEASLPIGPEGRVAAGLGGRTFSAGPRRRLSSWLLRRPSKFRPEGMGMLSFRSAGRAADQSASHIPTDHQPARQ